MESKGETMGWDRKRIAIVAASLLSAAVSMGTTSHSIKDPNDPLNKEDRYIPKLKRPITPDMYKP